MEDKPAFLLAVVAALIPSCAAFGADDSADPKDIIAAKVRRQGYECHAPKSATRDPGFTAPGEIGWMLECDGANYRVMLMPHGAARVERADTQAAH
jgi:hypothetical protein